MMNARSRLSLIILVLALVTHATVAQSPAEYEEERGKFPSPVFELFYAVKNSLDYAGLGEPRPPEQEIGQYKRVTPELLHEFEREWRVESYTVNGDDYELIVQGRQDRNIRYRATRFERFKWSDGKWSSLGGYLYF